VDVKKLPIGVQDFKALRSDGDYYVDKSLLIAQIFEANSKGVFLYTRPRRFGKSLNLSMIDAFLNMQHKGNPWFDGLAVSGQSELDRYRNAFPVIKLDLKDVDVGSRGKLIHSMGERIREAIMPHRYLEKSDKVDPRDKEIFTSLAFSKASEEDLNGSLRMLSRMLHHHHEVPAVILVDEYDAPLHKAYGTETHADALSFLKLLLGAALKGNDSMQLAVVTGILQISKESIFSELNNFRVNNILSQDSNEMYGFTEAEVRRICEDYGRPDKFEEAKEWYDGYRFGRAEIYNPWSVLSYVALKFVPSAYWVNTSRNSIINDLMARADHETYDNLMTLGSGGSVNTIVDPETTYDDLGRGGGAIYSMLALSGYLKAVPEEGRFCDLSIPNKELYQVFGDLVSRGTGMGKENEWLESFATAVLRNDPDAMAKRLSKLMKSTLSYHVLDSHGSYQAYMVGLLMRLSGSYEITADFESGEGRHDILMKRRKGNGPNVVIEIKKAKAGGKEDESALKKLAQEALRQIRDKDYAHKLDGPTIAYGVAFSSKTPYIVSEKLR